MSDVNQVVLIGRLVRDTELKYTSNGKAVTRFTLAVNEKRKAGDEWKDTAGFFEIVLWGQTAESLDPYLLKGKQVAVTGKLTQERWDYHGENRSKVVVTAATVQLLSGSANNGGGAGGNYAPPPVSGGGFTDEIPF